MSPSSEVKSPAAPAPSASSAIAGSVPTYLPRPAAAGNDPTADAPAVVRRTARRAVDLLALSTPAAAVSPEWPSSHELYVAARSHRAFVVGETLASIVEAAAAGARRLLALYRERRRVAAAREALHELDARALHDIGLDRSEIGSITAEWAGRAERSRLQIAGTLRQSPRDR